MKIHTSVDHTFNLILNSDKNNFSCTKCTVNHFIRLEMNAEIIWGSGETISSIHHYPVWIIMNAASNLWVVAYDCRRDPAVNGLRLHPIFLFTGHFSMRQLNLSWLRCFTIIKVIYFPTAILLLSDADYQQPKAIFYTRRTALWKENTSIQKMNKIIIDTSYLHINKQLIKITMNWYETVWTTTKKLHDISNIKIQSMQSLRQRQCFGAFRFM